MPAKFDGVMINCGKCGGVAGFKCYYKISGDDYPELKAQILDGSLFVANCVKCRSDIQVAQTLRYSDYSPGKNFFVYLCPKENLAESYAVIQSLPGLRSANGTKVYVVNTLDELQKVISSFDFGLIPPETHIDQSVDSARQGEAVTRQVDSVFESFARGELPPGLQSLAEKKRKLPWYKRWFG